MTEESETSDQPDDADSDAAAPSETDDRPASADDSTAEEPPGSDGGDEADSESTGGGAESPATDDESSDGADESADTDSADDDPTDFDSLEVEEVSRDTGDDAPEASDDTDDASDTSDDPDIADTDDASDTSDDLDGADTDDASDTSDDLDGADTDASDTDASDTDQSLEAPAPESFIPAEDRPENPDPYPREEKEHDVRDVAGPTDTMAPPESDLETEAAEVDDPMADADEADATEHATVPEAAGDGGGTAGVHQEVNKVQEVPTPTPPGAEEPEPVPEYTEPPDDEELPLTEHIEEMVKRLGVVMIAAAVVTVLAFPLAEDLITVVWYHVHPGTVANCPGADRCTPPHVYGPLELKLAELKLASLAGIIAALPVFVYESYLFMRPGLYPQERRYYLAAVPTSLVLALVGVAFSYFLVLPALFTYFLYYSQESVDEIAFALRQTFDLIMMMLGFMAVVFQIPLFIMLAIMMGITTRAWLASRRLYFWGAFAGIAFLFSPDPTGMAPIIVAATMVTLFEGTLLILKWVRR